MYQLAKFVVWYASPTLFCQQYELFCSGQSVRVYCQTDYRIKYEIHYKSISFDISVPFLYITNFNLYPRCRSRYFSKLFFDGKGNVLYYFYMQIGDPVIGFNNLLEIGLKYKKKH